MSPAPKVLATPAGYAQPLGKEDYPNVIRLPPLAHKVTPPESLPCKLDHSSNRHKSPRGRVLTPLSTTTNALPISPPPIDKATVDHHVAKLQAQHSNDSPSKRCSANFAADLAVSENSVNRRLEEDAKLNEELDELRKKVLQDNWNLGDLSHTNAAGNSPPVPVAQWHPAYAAIGIALAKTQGASSDPQQHPAHEHSRTDAIDKSILPTAGGASSDLQRPADDHSHIDAIGKSVLPTTGGASSDLQRHPAHDRSHADATVKSVLPKTGGATSDLEWHRAHDHSHTDAIGKSVLPKTSGESSNLQSMGTESKRVPNMNLAAPSPMADDGSGNVQSGSYEMQPPATYTSSGGNPFLELVSLGTKHESIAKDPFESGMTAVATAAVATASQAWYTEDEAQVRPCPAPPCCELLSIDMKTDYYCASKLIGTLAGARDSSFISSYDEELAYVEVHKRKLGEFWSNVDETLSHPSASHDVNFQPEAESRDLDLHASAHGDDMSPQNSPQHSAVPVEETKPENSLAQASKELQISVWVGDASRLESAIAEAHKTGVSASEISIAEQVLRREANKKQMEEQLEDAVNSRDVHRIKTSINEAVKTGVMPSKIRAAKLVLRDLEDV